MCLEGGRWCPLQRKNLEPTGKAPESTTRKFRSLSLQWAPRPQAALLCCTHLGGFLLGICLQQGMLAAVHLPRIQEIKHGERLRQGLRQPLGIVHDVVVQVSAVGVEHQVLLMCGLDHDRVAVPDCKRSPPSHGRLHSASPTRSPLSSVCRPLQGG